MKLIIAGSRDLNIANSFIRAILRHYNIYYDLKEIVSGGASGIDSCGEAFVKDENECLTVPNTTLKQFLANWETHGKAAGPIRNKEMAEYADALLLIWDGKSRGSASMKKEMQKLNKPIYEVILK